MTDHDMMAMARALRALASTELSGPVMSAVRELVLTVAITLDDSASMRGQERGL